MPGGHVLLQMFSSLISTHHNLAPAHNKNPSACNLGRRRLLRTANLGLMLAAFTWEKRPVKRQRLCGLHRSRARRAACFQEWVWKISVGLLANNLIFKALRNLVGLD